MTSLPFREFMAQTKPGPQHRCPTCQTFGLRTYTEPGSQEEKVVCTNKRCADSPLHRDE
jgi:hypothetical protein